MPDIVLPNVVREGFSIQLEARDPIRLKLSGNADLDMLTELEPYLVKLHQEVCRQGLPAVEVDIRELYFMNSACLKSFTSWIARVNQLERVRRYDLRFLANPNLSWQKRSLEAMRGFAPAVVSVVTALQ